MTTALFASPVNASAYGAHPIFGRAGINRDRQRITGRIDPDAGPSLVEAPQYHLYAGWSCPRSHAAAITIAQRGLGEFVSVSYLDGLRDARGWAFRERTGPDPINGFSLLRQVYAASHPDYRGEVTLPLLWDRRSGRILSSDPDTIDVDLASAFSQAGPALHKAADDTQLTELTAEVRRLERSIVRAVYHEADRRDLHSRLADLERRLTARTYLIGDELSLADIRLWVVLVRYDAGPNAHGAAGPRLSNYPAVADYTQRLWQVPGFAATTNFEAFAAPGTGVPEWLIGSAPRAGRRAS